MTGSPDYLASYVRSFFEDHLTCRRNVSPHTLLSYRDGLKLLLRFAAQHLKRSAAQLRVTDITEGVVIDFLMDLERNRANTIQTRNHRLVGIRNLFEYIATREPRLLDHCHKILTIPRKRGAQVPEIGYLEKEQVTALLGAISPDAWGGRRDYALLLFMYNTGARVQEVADTRISWLTLRAPYKVELLGKGRKWRTCPLWESTVQHVRRLLDERGPSLKPDDHLFVNRFGQPLSRSGIADILDRHVRRAVRAMPSLGDRKVTPHTLRHTTAMHLLQSGVEVNVIRSWLGHVSIATTNRYIEIDLAMKAKALETCQLGHDQPPVASWHSNPDILEWLESL
jgi:integrase/recombinase XerD